MSRKAKVERANALERLRNSLPSTDPPETWRRQYAIMEERLESLRWLYGFVAVLVVLAAIVATLFAIALLFGPGVRVGISAGSGLAAAALSSLAVRKMLSWIPGFSWAREYDELVDLLRPFKDELDRRAGRPTERDRLS